MKSFARLCLVILLPLVALSAPATRESGIAGQRSRPNILCVVAEDINPHLGCYGEPIAQTPNLDRLAGQGLRFENCWSTYPVCAPARTALITGMYPDTLGAGHMRSALTLPGTQKLLPELLRDAGYYCSNNSKEDYNLLTERKIWDESSRRAHWRNRVPGQPFFAVFNIEATHESRIRALPHTLRHDPSAVRLPAYHPDAPEVRRDWAQYHDNITAADELFARFWQELDEAGLARDTVVIFYGDNGSGMPRSKRWPYNSGLRVPFIIHVPEAFGHLAPRGYAPGAATRELVEFTDFAPSLLSLAGIKPPGTMQGRAFMGQHRARPRQFLYGYRGRMDERYDLVRSVRDMDYIYIRNYLPHRIYGEHVEYMFETPTTRVWRDLSRQGRLDAVQNVFWEPKPSEELYDLRADPDEVRNLAGSTAHRRVIKKLGQELRRHALSIQDLGFIPEPEQHRLVGEAVPQTGELISQGIRLRDVLEMAEVASAEPGRRETTKRLGRGLRSAQAPVRYWAALGCRIQGAEVCMANHEALELALRDASASVRIAAAEALAKWGGTAARKQAEEVLVELCMPSRHGFYTSLLALNSLESLEPQLELERQRLWDAGHQEEGLPQRLRGNLPKMWRHLGVPDWPGGEKP